jgi:hypothetical protein
MAKFQKGQPRAPGAGARKGQVFKKRTPDLIEGLLENGCNYDQELGKAILAKDAVMIRALSELLPYIRPRFKEAEKKEESPIQDTLVQISDYTTEQLLRDVSGS